jgi:hypothetical protein
MKTVLSVNERDPCLTIIRTFLLTDELLFRYAELRPVRPT